MATTTALKTASVLAFQRKLDTSDGLFFAGRWPERGASESWLPVQVREKSVRGTISNRLSAKESDPAKLNAKIENANLQTVDFATLPMDADTLKLVFTLKVLPGAGAPSACNSAPYATKLMEIVSGYIATHGFGELAMRYAHNLANGRFLWRNRIGAEDVEVNVEQIIGGLAARKWTFDGLALSLDNFETPEKDGHRVALLELAHVISSGLTGSSHVLLRITAFARIGSGQEVFPSQEMILAENGGGKKKTKKSKTLYSIAGIAGMHSQKIGNAVRTIDSWYLGNDLPADQSGQEHGPIAVDPYGSVTTKGVAYRQPSDKTDFYSILDGWVIDNKDPSINQKHFVMATLIRGGVFGEAE